MLVWGSVCVGWRGQAHAPLPAHAGLLRWMSGGRAGVCSGAGRRAPGAAGVAQNHDDSLGRVVREAGAGVGGGWTRVRVGGWLAWFALVRLGIGGELGGAWAGRLWAGFAGGGACGAAWGGGAGVELGDVGGGAALPGAGAGEGCEAEVAQDVLDDVVYGAVGDLGVEVWGVHAVEEFGVQDLGGVANAVAVVIVLAPEGVLDGTQDALAGGGAIRGGGVVWGRGAGGRLGGVEVLREHDAAADGAGDAVEGGGEVLQRCCGRWGRGQGWGGLHCCGLRRGRPVSCQRREGGGLLRGLGVGLVVQEAGDAGSYADEVVQGCAVPARVRGLWAGVVLRGGLGRLCGHKRKKNIVGMAVSRIAWRGEVARGVVRLAVGMIGLTN